MIQGSGLVLAQLSIAEFVNFQRKALPPLRSGWDEEEIEEQEKGGIGSSMWNIKKKMSNSKDNNSIFLKSMVKWKTYQKIIRSFHVGVILLRGKETSPIEKVNWKLRTIRKCCILNASSENKHTFKIAMISYIFACIILQSSLWNEFF